MTQGSVGKNRDAMPFYVLWYATVACFKRILSGPICVDSKKNNFALDSAGADYLNTKC